MNDSEIRERITAEHESGHAVASVALGGTVYAARVGFSGITLDGASGGVHDHGISDAVDNATVLFAGVIGASFCEGIPFGVIEPHVHRQTMASFKRTAKASRRKSAAGVERVPVPQTDLADPDALRRHIRAGGASDFDQAWRLLQKGRDHAEAENLFIAAQRMSMVLVAAHLQTIRGLSVALLDKRLLSGADLAGLLGGVRLVTREELAALAASLEPD